jgi:hypothetical protein
MLNLIGTPSFVLLFRYLVVASISRRSNCIPPSAVEGPKVDDLLMFGTFNRRIYSACSDRSRKLWGFRQKAPKKGLFRNARPSSSFSLTE